LLWAYKSTKENFERIERRSTQLMVDDFCLGYFSKKNFEVPAAFKTYVENKRLEDLKQKYTDEKAKKLNPEYVYLKNRLAAIEAAVKHFLGAREMKRMEGLYEDEYSRRILEARDH
jgi:hypothetical protein